MNILIKSLIDDYKITKYRISKTLGVSWNTVHFWYRGVYKPDEAHLQKIVKLYKETKAKKLKAI